MSSITQNYDNHSKSPPKYFMVASALIGAHMIWAMFVMATAFSLSSVMSGLFAIGILMIAFYARLHALGVQDRVIRLEEQIRLERILGSESREDIHGMATGQLIGLRFASDGEVAALFRTIVEEDIEDRNEIKKRVKVWRADHQRI
mgnify:CR=1 FL=1